MNGWGKTILRSVGVLWGVATLVFFLFRVLPGDPARMMLDQREDSEQLARIRAELGFDQPLAVQYLYFLNDLSPVSWHSSSTSHFTSLGHQPFRHFTLFNGGKGSLVLKAPWLRESFQKKGRSVTSIIGQVLGNTAILALAAMAFALVVGLSLGIATALLRDSWFDRSMNLLTTAGMALPSFFSALLMAWIFGHVLAEFTGLSTTGNFREWDDLGEQRLVQWRNLILPAFTLGIRPLSVIVQITRGSLMDVLQQDYIRTARAKGLPEWRVVLFHGLRNAMNPVVTAVSGWMASLLAGAVFVEYIFGWNGLGKLIVDALNTLDLPVIMGGVLTIATTFVLINLLVEQLYRLLDPRIATPS
jgi:peptide/nickel transport system permease protein